MCVCLCEREKDPQPAVCAVCPWSSGRVRCVLSSAGSGPGYDTVFSVVLMRTLQRSDAGCKSPPHPPCFSPSSGPYLDVRSGRIVCDGSVLLYDTCKHGRCFFLKFILVLFFWVLSSLCLCSGSLFLSCSVFLLHHSTNVQHPVCVFSMVFILYYTTTLSLGVNSAVSQRWCCCWSPSVWIHVCLCQTRAKYRPTALQDGCKSHLYCALFYSTFTILIWIQQCDNNVTCCRFSTVNSL